MKKLKALLAEMDRLDAESDRLDEEYANADIDDEETEAAWDAAYKAAFDAREAVVNYIIKLAGIKPSTARAMISHMRGRLDAIAEKE
jgi:hypothetical protein